MIAGLHWFGIFIKSDFRVPDHPFLQIHNVQCAILLCINVACKSLRKGATTVWVKKGNEDCE